MDNKRCPFCDKFSPYNEECYCFLEEGEDNEYLKPHGEGFEDIVNKSMETHDVPVKSFMADFKKSDSAVCQSKGYLSVENILPENKALGLSFQASPIAMDSSNMDECKMQSGSSKSTPGNEQSNSDSVIALEAKNIFEISDFAREEVKKCGDVNQVEKVKLRKKLLTASGELIPDSNYKVNETVSNKKPLIYVADGEGTSVALPSGIQLQSCKRRKFKCFVCDICKKPFRQKHHLRDHERTHTGEKPFGCHSCGKIFTQKKYLTKHLLTHTGEKAFTCDICGKAFTAKSSIKLHHRIHSGEKNFECPHCGKKFGQKAHLNSHVLIHTGQKSFSCDTCGKRFGRKQSLKCHQLTHTGQKSFSCDTCGKRFGRKQSLKRHQLTHTGQKSFSCDTCGKRFGRKESLKRHQRTHT